MKHLKWIRPIVIFRMLEIYFLVKTNLPGLELRSLGEPYCWDALIDSGTHAAAQ